MKKVIGLIALAGVTAIACSVEPTQEKEPSTGKAMSALSSDILHGTPALKAAIAAVWNPLTTDVDYRIPTLGTVAADGPSQGAEQSLRNGSSLTNPSTAALYQSLSPMSRDFEGNNACGQGSLSGVCCPGERSNLVGYGAVDVAVKSAESVTNIPSESSNHFLKKLFCGDDNGSTAGGGSYPTGCITTFTENSHTWPSTGTGVPVRPDFDTEAMDQFRRFTGCKADSTRGIRAFCSGVLRVTKAGGTLAVFQSSGGSETDVTSTYVAASNKPCTSSDSAPACISNISGSDVSSNRYLGFSDRQPGGAIGANAKLLTIHGVARGTTTTVTNIRDLSYPLAYELWLNEDTGTTSDADETLFYNALYKNTSSAKTTFETALTNEGFVKCHDTNPLECGSGVCPAANGSAVNDGRGVGNCASSARCER